MDKHEEMVNFWSERANRYASDPRANTNDVWLREIEIDCVNKVISSSQGKNILDFGCANGYTTIRLAELNPSCCFSGIDINREMIGIAKTTAGDGNHPNLNFEQVDILSQSINKRYDLIFAVRAFQNIESFEKQCLCFDALYPLLNPGGVFFYIESYADGYEQINKDRMRMGLPLLPIHNHLTLLTEKFEKYISKSLRLVERVCPSSTYYLVTRLVYSYIAKTNGEPIDYNHPLHQISAIVPQIGNYGPQMACLFKKREGLRAD
jgi:2-polyprenyl-3-methyl-5-hydroxy-6-metoxy-1,4-benzoquinol methylase